MDAFIKTLDVEQGVVTAVVKIPLKPITLLDEQSDEFKALSKEQVVVVESENALADKENLSILGLHPGRCMIEQN